MRLTLVLKGLHAVRSLPAPRLLELGDADRQFEEMFSVADDEGPAIERHVRNGFEFEVAVLNDGSRYWVVQDLPGNAATRERRERIIDLMTHGSLVGRPVGVSEIHRLFIRAGDRTSPPTRSG